MMAASNNGTFSYTRPSDASSTPSYVVLPSASSTTSFKILRCLKCAKLVEATSTDDLESLGMIQIGYNLHYCKRCADIVGYTSLSELEGVGR
ncbi:hypothetical protein BKA67DRAFT_417462 [Truncatella angustata]|uniref:Uncharacterized protein n=1 Tax=Truncatella angustata TaxID=152316 RepID=A0A9P8RIU3_9PEZI|nr:uncharacterized protein BKA67DRAFT_417462 [Truncatella angustata]KAH6646833.1 hypothetical protein BKA67DRAFT_417462 [Truncatella angustata]